MTPEAVKQAQVGAVALEARRLDRKREQRELALLASAAPRETAVAEGRPCPLVG